MKKYNVFKYGLYSHFKKESGKVVEDSGIAYPYDETEEKIELPEIEDSYLEVERENLMALAE